MATPKEYIGALYDYAGLLISSEIRSKIRTDSRILDVGAGWGKYRFLLPEYEMDAVDIWAPYAEQNKLDAYYRKVFIEDAADFNFKRGYDAVIMGDVLEHLPVARAQQLVKRACEAVDYVFIATPFAMPQEEVEGNPHEAHAQEDLNEEIMVERYPELELLDKKMGLNNFVKSVYVKKGQK